MRKAGLIVILIGLLIGGCGSTSQTVQLPTIPASPPSAITPSPILSASSIALLDSPALESRTASSKTTPVPTPQSGPTSASPATEVAMLPAHDTPQVEPGAAFGEPVRIVIQGIGMDRRLVSVGLDGNNVPIVPEHDVGWYNLSAMPGHDDNVVLWGHVLRFKNAPNIPAPFARMKDLAPGAKITLYDGAGNARTYAVARQVWAMPNQVEYILPKSKEMITLVSCIGDKVVSRGDVEMTHRLITIAMPV